uniref:Conotoxin n=1 Tax=Conus praecellens TaxID=128530 RepID=A0A291C2I5_CONPC|nr:conotoxin [Conus praecellens]
MKLTCVLIVAVLSLTACQLITADHSRDKEYLAARFRDGMRNSKVSRECKERSEECSIPSYPCCSGLTCVLRPNSGKNGTCY